MEEQDKLPIPQKARQPIEAIKACMADGHPIMDSYSGGKDSSICTDLIFKAALELKAETGSAPPIFVTHADTRVENPEIHQYAKAEITKIHSFAKTHNLDVSVSIARPYLNASWAVQIIGGRFLPVFANTANRTCSIDFKVEPMKRLKKQIVKGSNYKSTDFVTIMGTRFDEGTSRAGRMEKRKETDDIPWQNGRDGSMALSPIANWTAKDVWDYLTLLKNERSSYSDFEDLFRLYKDGSSPKDLENGVYKTRYGCMVCTVGRDKSMGNLIRNNPDRYGYMKPLIDLQNFLQKTNYDMTRRSWIGRSIDKHGFITITPDIYHPEMLAELLRYCMTIDFNEKKATRKIGIEPRFELISPETLLAIDATWSLQGYHKPHTALLISDEVYGCRKLSPIPNVKKHPRPMHFPKKHLYVGANWHMDWDNRFYGLRDIALEAFGGSGCMGTKNLKNGRTVMDNEQAVSFSFDPEALDLFFQFEYPDIIAKKREGYYEDFTCSSGFVTLVRLGVLQLAKGKEHLADKILVRTNVKENLGLTGPGADVERLLNQAITHTAYKKYVKAIADGESPTLPHPHISYCSGACNISDVRGLIKARIPICISLDRLKFESPVYREIVDYAADKKGHVLIDSGAFTAFTRGKEMDFDKVFEMYEHLAKATDGYITVVGPDKVGDQVTTFQLLEKYAFRIRDMINKGARILIPVQKGDIPPGVALQIACDILATDRFGVAVPSNKKAFSDNDLQDLLSSGVNIKVIHFLGMTAANPRMSTKKALIEKLAPGVEVTMDGNRLRANYGQGQPITVKQSQLITALEYQTYKENIAGNTITLSIQAESETGPFAEYAQGSDQFYDYLHGELSVDELTQVIEPLVPYDSKHNALTLAIVCHKHGPDHGKLINELGPDWYVTDDVYAALRKISQSRLTKEIQSYTIDHSHQIVKEHAGSIRSEAVEHALSHDNAYFAFV